MKNKQCLHEAFESDVAVTRLCEKEGMNPSHYSADIKIQCSVCKQEFRFLGVPPGLSSDRPMASLDGCELRVPIHPANGTIPLPPKIRGFSVSVVKP